MGIRNPQSREGYRFYNAEFSNYLRIYFLRMLLSLDIFTFSIPSTLETVRFQKEIETFLFFFNPLP